MAGLHIMRGRKRPLPVVLVAALRDSRHELFALLVADGMAQVEAFVRAGLADKRTNSAAVLATNLAARPAVRARIANIVETRRATAAITLPEVTDMLKRVYASGLADGELGPAHNAAFSLARLHGHVIDKAQVEVIRRPTRDPDAPSEKALEGWLQALPSPEQNPSNIIELAAIPQGSSLEPSSLEPEKPNEIKGLTGAGRSENGAPVAAVTGTPSERGRTEPEAPARQIAGPPPEPPEEKRVPPRAKRVPVSKGKKAKKPLSGAEKRKRKIFKELFG